MSACRLCLQKQSTTGPLIPLLDSFTGPDDDRHTDLVTKIRTCLGVVFLDPSSEDVICINCHLTVLFVDDFRSLCLQTNQVFGLISVEGDDDPDKKASYQMYAEELRRMVQERKNGVQQLVDAAGVGQVKVKLEPGAEEIDDVGQQKETFVISTIEMVKGEPMEEESLVVEVPKIQEPCRTDSIFEDDETFSLDLKLTLTKEVRRHSELWNAIYESSELQTQIWSKIANQMNLDVEAIQEYWHRLQIMFHDYQASGVQTSTQMTQKQLKLMKDLQTILDGTTKNVEMRARLADEILKRSIIWDDRHPDYDKDRRRRVAWDEIAKMVGTNRVVIRSAWSKFVNDARKNPETDERMLANPLYRLLHETLAAKLRPESRWPPRRCDQRPSVAAPEIKSAIPELPQRAQRPLGGFEIREKLAEEILQHEVIWNDQHPDFRSSAMRGEIFKEIASRLEVDWRDVRREWGLVLSLARKSSEENGGKVDEKLYAKDPLQKLLNITVVERLGAIPRRRYKPSTEKRKKREQKKVAEDNYCEQCNKYIPRKRFEGHMNAHNGVQPYECTHEGCGKRFTNKENLRKHGATAHAELRFECKECDRKFVAQHKLEVHVALVHKSQELPCTICGKLLKHRSSLLIHMRRHEVKFPCSFCDAQLSTKHALNEHERIHTNEKPFPCEQCDKRFRTNTAKRMHVYKMHFVPAAGTS